MKLTNLVGLMACGATILGSTARASASPGDIGLSVLVQTWNPLTDDDTPRRPLDDRTLISRSYSDGWDTIAPTLNERLTQLLSTPNMIASGISLDEIVLGIAKPTLSMQRNGGGGDAPLDLTFTLAFDHIHVEATSTTPDVAFGIGAGSYADPRCSLDFGLTVTLPVTVGSDTSQPLASSITSADAVTRPIARIHDFGFDSQNLPCDILVDVLSVTGLDDKLTDLVTNPARSEVRELNQTLIAQFQRVLAGANDALSAIVPAGLVRLNAWASSGPEALITLAFGQRGPFPYDGVPASLTGSFVSATENVGLDQEVACDLLKASAARKTGPRPILTPLGELGVDPIEVLGDAKISCRGNTAYSLDGLAANFPNFVKLGSDSGCTTPNPASVERIVRVRAADGADFGVVLPSDFAKPYNLVAEAHSELCGAQVLELQSFEQRYLDPRVNPAWTSAELNSAIIIVGGAAAAASTAETTTATNAGTSAAASATNSASSTQVSVNRAAVRTVSAKALMR